MPGKFVVKKGSTGKFRFNLLSTNGQIVASSESYNSKASAMAGIRSVQKMASGADIEDQTTAAWAKEQEAAKAAAAAKKVAARTKKAAAKKSAAKKAPAKKSSARKAPARKASARKAPAKKR